MIRINCSDLEEANMIVRSHLLKIAIWGKCIVRCPLEPKQNGKSLEIWDEKYCCRLRINIAQGKNALSVAQA